MTNGNDQVYPNSQSRRVVKNDTGAIQEYDIATSADGLTKREYFAAMALQGLIEKDTRTVGDFVMGMGALSSNATINGALACGAVAIANALIDALNKEK